MADTFNHALIQLTGIAPDRLDDTESLAAVAVAAAGAIGLAGNAPVSCGGPRGAALALLGTDGHVVLHTVPTRGLCLVDIVARAPIPVSRGVDVIARRLGAAGAESAGP